jgi:hypothetical protein
MSKTHKQAQRALRLAGYNGIAAEQLAFEWSNHGYSDKQATRWIHVGVTDPCDAMDAEDAGETPEDYR